MNAVLVHRWRELAPKGLKLWSRYFGKGEHSPTPSLRLEIWKITPDKGGPVLLRCIGLHPRLEPGDAYFAEELRGWDRLVEDLELAAKMGRQGEQICRSFLVMRTVQAALDELDAPLHLKRFGEIATAVAERNWPGYRREQHPALLCLEHLLFGATENGDDWVPPCSPFPRLTTKEVRDLDHLYQHTRCWCVWSERARAWAFTPFPRWRKRHGAWVETVLLERVKRGYWEWSDIDRIAALTHEMGSVPEN